MLDNKEANRTLLESTLCLNCYVFFSDHFERWQQDGFRCCIPNKRIEPSCTQLIVWIVMFIHVLSILTMTNLFTCLSAFFQWNHRRPVYNRAKFGRGTHNDFNWHLLCCHSSNVICNSSKGNVKNYKKTVGRKTLFRPPVHSCCW